MNYANIAKSKRLQVILKSLQDGPKTTAQLGSLFQDMAVHSTVSEIRRNGYTIKCSVRNVTEDGRRVYLYRLIK